MSEQAHHGEHHHHHEHQEPEKTQLELAREELEADSGFIDLIDTNFHRNGFLYPADELASALSAYPATRPYAPDPRGNPATREAIAAYYRRRGLHVGSDQIIVTASASEGYNLVFNRMLEHDHTVALPRPVYPLFEFIAEFNGLEVEHYALDLENGAQPNPTELRDSVSANAGLLVAISPNNPTGTCLTRESMEAIASLARERNLPILSDEVFSEFRYPPESPPHVGPADLADDVLCITLNGVSKMFASPDLKVSWLLVTGPEDLREELLSVLEIANDMYLNASSVSQSVVPLLFESGQTFREEMVSELARRRDLCLRTLERSTRLRPVVPTGGIHCILRVRPGASGLDEEHLDDEALAERILRETKVYTHPGYLYDVDEETALVMSFLKTPELLTEGLERLIRWFER